MTKTKNDSEKNDVKVLDESKKPYEISDLNGVYWAMKKLKGIKDGLEEKKAFYDKERKALDNWLEEVENSANSEKAYFEGLLFDYYQKELAKNEKAKISTPIGKLTKRRSSKREYQEEVLLNELKNKGYSFLINVKTEESVDKKGLQKEIGERFQVSESGKVITENGEILEGVTITEQVDYKVVLE